MENRRLWFPAGTVVGFTGTRHGMTYWQKRTLEQVLLAARPESRILLGCCVGADEEAFYIADNLGFELHGYPPRKKDLMNHLAHDRVEPPADYLARDRAIVRDCNVLIACPQSLADTRGGTWYTFNQAEKAKRPRVLVAPTGARDLFDWPENWWRN